MSLPIPTPDRLRGLTWVHRLRGADPATAHARAMKALQSATKGGAR